MTSDLLRLFDAYNRQARLYPALIALLPLVLAIIAWLPNVGASGVPAVALTLIPACGVLYFLSSFARSRGKAIEPGLIESWGGWPATIFLRHSDHQLSQQTKGRYHAMLKEHVPGLTLPTGEEEAGNPLAADEAYASAVDWLRERSRGDKLSAIENAEYGFRRNLLGLRPYGIIIGVLALLLQVGGFYLSVLRTGGLSIDSIITTTERLPALVWVSAAIAGIVLAFWLFIANRRWVQQAAHQFARAFLANCDKPGLIQNSGGKR